MIEVTVSNDVLLAMAEFVVPGESERPCLECIHFEIEAGRTWIVAADGYSLGVYLDEQKTKIGKHTALDLVFDLPIKPFLPYIETGGTTTLRVSRADIQIHRDGVIWTLPREEFEVRYPNWRGVFRCAAEGIAASPYNGMFALDYERVGQFIRAIGRLNADRTWSNYGTVFWPTGDLTGFLVSHENFFGMLMPMRLDMPGRSPEVPDWAMELLETEKANGTPTAS